LREDYYNNNESMMISLGTLVLLEGPECSGKTSVFDWLAHEKHLNRLCFPELALKLSSIFAIGTSGDSDFEVAS